MKLFLTLLCLLPFILFAQTADSTAVDTTIYNIADETPRFPSPCETLDTTSQAKAECAQIALLNFVNRRVLYPAEAREQNISGMVVIGFVVEKNGLISRAKVMKDPGGGLGIAALRSVIGMAREVRFRPAFIDEKPVRYNFVLPIRFRLEEAKPYVVSGRDTIYTKLTKALTFKGDLTAYLNENINYPASGEDSCRTGQLDIQLLVHPDGSAAVQDIIDYNDLGTDFTFEAISAVTNSYGQWTPGEYEGKVVTSPYDVSFYFAPESATCAGVVTAYNEAIDLINEGQVLAQDSTTLAAGLAKMDLAVERFPKDGRFRIVRGQTRMDNNLLTEACEDLTLAKRITLVDWYDAILPLLCREVEK
ncbi:MAG: energy transducer TonB [Bacteroidota bacterium]